MTKQWIVYSPEVDLYYFDNYEDALKEYEELKDHLMAEGHEPGAQVHLLETIKVATSVIDEEKMKISTPKDEGFDWDNWAKWVELNATIEWERSYEKESLDRGILIEQQQQEIDNLKMALWTCKNSAERIISKEYGETMDAHEIVDRVNDVLGEDS